jgi:hypothetical protein
MLGRAQGRFSRAADLRFFGASSAAKHRQLQLLVVSRRSPAAIASRQGGPYGYTRGSSRLASGADADALREVWRQFLDYEISGREVDMPASMSMAIPVEVSGTRYQLFIRDSIPLEASNGLIAY